jgi:hypothetical protein
VITTTRRRLRSLGNGFLPRYSLEVPERKEGDNKGLLDTVKRLLAKFKTNALARVPE